MLQCASNSTCNAKHRTFVFADRCGTSEGSQTLQTKTKIDKIYRKSRRRRFAHEPHKENPMFSFADATWRRFWSPFQGQLDVLGPSKSPVKGQLAVHGLSNPPFQGQLDVPRSSEPPFQGQLDVTGCSKPPFQGQLDVPGPLTPPFQGQLDVQGLPKLDELLQVQWKDPGIETSNVVETVVGRVQQNATNFCKCS